eukprot:3459935-Pyramimonas_sp.AAC.1
MAKFRVRGTSVAQQMAASEDDDNDAVLAQPAAALPPGQLCNENPIIGELEPALRQRALGHRALV